MKLYETDTSSSSPKKQKAPRGRPRIQRPIQNQTERRRAQVREAQRTYRLKKETAIHDLQAKVSILESTVGNIQKLFQELYKASVKVAIKESSGHLMQTLIQVEMDFRQIVAMKDFGPPGNQDLYPINSQVMLNNLSHPTQIESSNLLAGTPTTNAQFDSLMPLIKPDPFPLSDSESKLSSVSTQCLPSDTRQLPTNPKEQSNQYYQYPGQHQTPILQHDQHNPQLHMQQKQTHQQHQTQNHSQVQSQQTHQIYHEKSQQSQSQHQHQHQQHLQQTQPHGPHQTEQSQHQPQQLQQLHQQKIIQSNSSKPSSTESYFTENAEPFLKPNFCKYANKLDIADRAVNQQVIDDALQTIFSSDRIQPKMNSPNMDLLECSGENSIRIAQRSDPFEESKYPYLPS